VLSICSTALEERTAVVAVALCERGAAVVRLPNLDIYDDLSATISAELCNAHVIAVQQVLSEDESLKSSGFRIAASAGRQVRVVEVDEELRSCRLLGDIELGFVPDRITIGGRDGRTICASAASGRHALVCLFISPGGFSRLGLAADINPVHSSVQGGLEARGGGEGGGKGEDKRGGNAFLSVLTLGMASRTDRQRDESLAVSLSGERWLLYTGAEGLHVYSSFGAKLQSGAEAGFGCPRRAVGCFGGAVVVMEDSTGDHAGEGQGDRKRSDGNPCITVAAASGGIGRTLQSFSLAGKARSLGRGALPTKGWKFEPSTDVEVAAVVRWPGTSWVALLRKRCSLSHAIGTLEQEGKLELALSLAVDGPDVDGRRRIYEQLARKALRAGKHAEALSYVRRGDYSVEWLLRLRDEEAPETWSRQENVSPWAATLYDLRRYGAAASDPNGRVDMAVLEALCLSEHTSERIVDLFRGRHAVDADQGEALLRSEAHTVHLPPSERERALVELARSCGRHDSALRLIEASELSDAPWRTAADYIAQVDDEAVIRQHLPKILAHVQEDGELLQRAVGALAESRLAPTAKIEVAASQDPRFAAAYAEATLANTVVDRRRAQNVLIRAICQLLRRGRAASGDGGGDEGQMERQALDSYRAKLDEQLSGAVEDPAQVLQWLPDELWEKQAELLGSLGRHEEATSIIATKGGDAAAAERYCSSLKEEDRGPALTALVRTYLEMGSSRPELVSRAARVLGSRGGSGVDVASVLKSVDSESMLGDLREFLLTAVSLATASARAARAHRALLKSEVLRQRAELLQLRSRSISVTSDLSCSVCSRRIGDSVFAAYNDGSLVHYACYRASAAG